MLETQKEIIAYTKLLTHDFVLPGVKICSQDHTYKSQDEWFEQCQTCGHIKHKEV